jgi:hypothetical protein
MEISTKLASCICLYSLLVLSSCSGNKQHGLTDIDLSSSNYDETPVNAIEQALPTIVVIPSDQLLKEHNALTTDTIDGVNHILRNYNQYLLNDENHKSLLSILQNEFVQLSFPLSDLEQTLKSLNNQSSLDEADNLGKDAKTILLTKVSPDIILEFTYSCNLDMNSRDLTKRLFSYTLSAIDAYTNKVFSSHTYQTEGKDVDDIFKKSLHKNMPQISKEINDYFADIVRRGREISVRIAVERGSNIQLSDENIEKSTYTDWLIDYIKVHAKKGAYVMQRNTDNELYFVNVRINTLNDDGTQFSAYDWGRELCTALRNQLGVRAVNKSQGLGEILITIKGM